MVDHHEDLAEYLEKHELSKAEAARLLSAATGDNISAKAVQSWLYGRGTQNARRCPGWVIYVLDHELGGWG